MLVTVRAAKDPLETPALRAMFEARKRVFVDLLGWNVPVVDGRFEIDLFDDVHAVYLVVTDPDGRHLGSARLLDTRRPHILGTLFPGLCDAPPPAGPGTWEITRFCLGSGLGAGRRRQVRDRLVSALCDHALARGIATYTGIAEDLWLRQVLEFGWDARRLGPPRRIDGRLLGALSIDITALTPSLLREGGLYEATALAAAALEAA